MADYDFSAGDTGSTLRVTCKDVSGVVINLTGATARLKWRKVDKTLASVVMTITNAAGGVAEYQFVAGELYDPGMDFRTEITDATGKILKNINTIYKTVRPAP